MTIEEAYRTLRSKDRPVYLNDREDADTLLWRILGEGYDADMAFDEEREKWMVQAWILDDSEAPLPVESSP